MAACIKAENPDAFFIDQLANPDNPVVHIDSAGPEIRANTDGKSTIPTIYIYMICTIIIKLSLITILKNYWNFLIRFYPRMLINGRIEWLKYWNALAKLMPILKTTNTMLASNLVWIRDNNIAVLFIVRQLHNHP